MENVQIKKMSLANIEGKLTPEEMENIMAGSGSWNWERCAVGGFATAIHLSGFGPWGFVGGLVGGCLVGQLR